MIHSRHGVRKGPAARLSRAALAASLLFSMGLAVIPDSFCAEENPPETAAEEEASGPIGSETRTVSLSEVREMVHRGHVYLAKTQNTDGSFSLDPENQSDYIRAPIAVTSLVCLSFMAGGNTPYAGPFRSELKKGLSYLIRICDPETGIFHDDLDDTSKMHGQGFAILALAQAYGMFGVDDRSLDRKALEIALKSSVDLVCRIQTEVGGWYYNPVFSSEHEGSITICIVEALRAARNAGIFVEKGVIDRAVTYVRRSQKNDGSFRYKLNDDKSSYALTAAGIATLNATGEYDSEAIDLGMAYMQKKDPVLNLVSYEMYPQYARFYAAQAYYQFSDLSLWKRWYPRFVEECREQQYPNGSFYNGNYGAVYATSVTTLTLQVPFGYLPIFER
jgi:hypothetical protein